MIEPMIEFLENYETLKDEKFLDYAKKIRGLVGPGSCELLNGCVKYIDDDKCYLEVGSFQGMSLCGAAMDNNIKCYGVENFGEEFKDNWDKFKPTERSNKFILNHNLKTYGSKNTKIFEQDYRTFFKGRKDVEGRKAEVYLYDGPHTYEHQTLGLLLSIPVLADQAIVFIDDYKCENVPRSIEKILSMNNGFKRKIKTWVEPYHDFREGFVALEFERS